MTRESPSTDALSSREAEAPEEPELLDYDLPRELIAQEPTESRHGSRLLVLDRGRDRIEHRRFREIPDCLRGGDILVVNDTRVIPARLRARRETGGAVEILLLEEEPAREGVWEVLLRPGRAGRPGSVMRIEGSGGVTARAVGRRDEAFLIEFLDEPHRLAKHEVLSLAERAGETPLPPYIERQPDDARSPRDRERYQTVWAAKPGAVAAPTAGLHFSRELVDELGRAGVERLSITLHIGIDTFRPLDIETLRSGRLHGERVEVSREVGERILEGRREGRRIIAVGTTTARALESFAASGRLPYRERTELFIRPGHRFRLVDALLTNFHLPRSSLLLLVAAFAGREPTLRAYREAVRERYRFYSYGDAMLIV